MKSKSYVHIFSAINLFPTLIRPEPGDFTARVHVRLMLHVLFPY